MSSEIELGGAILRSPLLTTTTPLTSLNQSPKPVTFNGLLTNRILSRLTGGEFAELLPFLEPISLTGGQSLFKPGDAVDFVYFPETSVVCHLHLLEDGSGAATTIIGNDGVVGLTSLFGSTPMWSWAEVTIAGNAMRMKSEVLRSEFARGGMLHRLLLRYMRDRLAQLSQRAVCHGRHVMRERLCTWLLMIHDRAGNQLLSLTHEKMAQHLGARRAGISAACSELRDLGVIKYRRAQLQIVDRLLLEQMACECYRTLTPRDAD